MLKNDVQRLTIEAEHKDEIIRMKDDEIKRIEHMAGYYGQQSTMIIEKLAGISHALTRLLPAEPSQPPKDAIVVSDSGGSATKKIAMGPDTAKIAKYSGEIKSHHRKEIRNEEKWR